MPSETPIWTAKSLSAEMREMVGEFILQWSLVEHHVDSMLSMLQKKELITANLKSELAMKFNRLSDVAKQHLSPEDASLFSIIADETLAEYENRNLVVHGQWRERGDAYELYCAPKAKSGQIRTLPISSELLGFWLDKLYAKSIGLILMRRKIAILTGQKIGATPHLE